MEAVNNYIETDLGNVAPNPCGEYTPGRKYEYLDMVALAGGSYICIVEGTDTAPVAGQTTKQWQCVATPGDLTPEYTAMHDDVANKAEQVEADTEEVKDLAQSVAGMETNVDNLQKQAQESAEKASKDKTSTSGYAAAAEKSAENAALSEQNVDAQVASFTPFVEEKKIEAGNYIAAERKKAVDAVTSQADASTKKVRDDTEKYIEEEEQKALQEMEQAGDKFLTDVAKIKDTVTTEGTKQIGLVEKTGAAQVKAVEDKGAEQTEKVTSEGATQVANVQAAAAEIIADLDQIQQNHNDIVDKLANAKLSILENGLLHIERTDEK